MHLLPVFFIFIPIFAAIIIFLFKSEKLSKIVFISQILSIILFIGYVRYLNENPEMNLLILGGADERIRISLYNDSLSLIFIGLTLFIWLMVLLYTYKMNKSENKFLFFLMFLQGVFLGLLQTNDLFNLFVFLELSAVLVTILIAYKKTGGSFRAGIYYLLLNTIGAMMFLIGIILLYYAYGTINIQWIMNHMSLHSQSATVKVAYIFMISGISVKAALFPVFTWLPKAHGVAQSTISALLSGLIVKGALYMFIRINNQMFLGANYQVSELFFWIGATTGIIGVIFALSQKDIKQLLAYSTISQIGLIIMGLSQVQTLSFTGGLIHILNHALFKSLLFFSAGMMIKAYQTKKIHEIKGVFKTMPILGVMISVGILAVSGAPFFNGFVSKSLIKYAFKEDIIKLLVFYIINIGTVIYFYKFAMMLFGPKVDLKIEKNKTQTLSISIISLMCVVIGLFYVPLGQAVLSIDLSYVNLFEVIHYMEYAIFIGIAFTVNRYILSKDFKVIKSIRSINLTFEAANYLFIIYILTIALFILS